MDRNQNNISLNEVINILDACSSNLCDNCLLYDETGWCMQDDDVGFVEVPKDVVRYALLLLEEQDRALKFQSTQLDNMLKEREPIKPLIANDMYFCGSCKYAIPRTTNYCPKCGKKVEWDD